MRKQTVAHIAFILGLIFAISGASCVMADPILSFNPSTQTVTSGQTFSVSVDITNVTDLYAFGFELNFDPAILFFKSAIGGSFLQGGTFVATENSPGVLSIGDSLSGLISGKNGDGTLAIINFTALALGTSTLALRNVFLLDSNLRFISTEEVESGAVAVVPEPATLLLLSTGLIGFFAYERSRSQRRFLLDNARRGRS